MFEDLPNEIILVIYSYLELTKLHRAFSSLNSRFDGLLFGNFTPLYACISSKCDFPFERYAFRVKQLSLINWNARDLLSFLYEIHLPEIKNLQIQSLDNSYFGHPTNDLICRIYSFQRLYRLTLSISPTIYIGAFTIPACESIRHLNLSMITLDTLFCLLPCSPNLENLTIWLNSNGRILNTSIYSDYQCSKLKSFAINLHNDVCFNEVTFLLTRMPVLRAFRIYGIVWDRRFLSHQIWEDIIMGSQSFPLLDKLYVNLSIRHSDVFGSHFRRHLFERIKFKVYLYQNIWMKMECSWDKNLQQTLS